MRQGLKAQLSSNSNDWSTPQYLLDQIEEEFGKVDFDPCPLKSKLQLALFDDWKGNIFINPPYSNVKEFLNKGLVELKKGNAKQLIYLIIPRTSTRYWRDYVMQFAECIYFIPYRLKFGGCNSAAPFPSCIIIFKNLIKKDHIICKSWQYKRPQTKLLK